MLNAETDKELYYAGKLQGYKRGLKAMNHTKAYALAAVVNEAGYVDAFCCFCGLKLAQQAHQEPAGDQP